MRNAVAIVTGASQGIGHMAGPEGSQGFGRAYVGKIGAFPKGLTQPWARSTRRS
jgi:hypothetical protein